MSSKSRRNFIRTIGTSALVAPFIGSASLITPFAANADTQALTSTSCDYRLLRHAAAIFNYNDQKFLIDPMLNSVVNNVPMPVSNAELTDIINALDAVLLTHNHSDHINLEAWQRDLLKDKPFFCQSVADGNYLSSIGMNDVRVIDQQTTFEGITIHKTGGHHGIGTGWDVSGFVFTAQDCQSVYIAGDTTYGEEVKKALNSHKPDVTIVNSGAVGPSNNPWTMTAEHVVSVATELPSTRIIAVHLEVHPSAKVTRAQLRAHTEANNIAFRVKIPANGETINLCNLTATELALSEEQSVKILPNPFTDKVKFTIPGTLKEIQIVDLQGKLVTKITEPQWNGQNNDGEAVPRGTYVMIVITHESVYTEKLVKI